MSREFTQEINWFADQMKAKMEHPRNLRKPHWATSGHWELWRRAVHELKYELSCEIDSGTAEDIISECCDVANFMMMIADNAKKGLLTRKEPPDA